MPTIHIKRIYESSSKNDGYRILIDRLWPRGIKKEDAHINKWMKDIAPSTELRKEFNHQPEKWAMFIPAYQAELKKNAALDELLSDIHKHHTVTLLYAARDNEHNHAMVLQQFINEHL